MFCFASFLLYQILVRVYHMCMCVCACFCCCLSCAQQEQKAAEREKASNVSTMRVSGPRPLDPDRYERFSCAVCMKIAAPLLLGPVGAGAESTTEGTEAGGAEATGKEAGGGAAAAAVDASIAECAKCGVRVHRECYGVPEGLGAPGAGENLFLSCHIFCFCFLFSCFTLCVFFIRVYCPLFVVPRTVGGDLRVPCAVKFRTLGTK